MPVLDWSKSHMTGKMVEFLDGFILGDGNLHKVKHTTNAHLRCGQSHKECADFFIKPFLCYKPTYLIRTTDDKQLSKINGKPSRGKIYTAHYYWTKSHPDLTYHWKRWYSEEGGWGKKKHIPIDVSLTPLSILVWWLGDGTLDLGYPTVALGRFCTNGFPPDEVDMLVSRLNLLGFEAKRNKRNQICLSGKGTLVMLDYIDNVAESKRGKPSRG